MSATTSTILARHKLPQLPTQQHIALLGATGGTGLEFIKEYLSLPNTPNKPYLTLYTRPSSLSKLNSILPNISANSNSNSNTTTPPTPRLRIIQGELNDPSTIRTAFSASTSSTNTPPSFPPVTTILSLLGAYATFSSFLLRNRTPTTLTDSLNTTILPTMQSLNIQRIIALSTAASFPLPGEYVRMSWSWWIANLLPRFMVPLGHAEMGGIARGVLDNEYIDDDSDSDKSDAGGAGGGGPGSSGSGSGIPKPKSDSLLATVVRVPLILDSGSADLKVAAFPLLGGEGSVERKAISKASLARWILREVEEGKWIGRAPVVCNPSAKV